MIGNVSVITPVYTLLLLVCVLMMFSFHSLLFPFFFSFLLFLSQRHSNLLECCSSLESALPLLVAKSKDPHLPFPPAVFLFVLFLILRNLLNLMLDFEGKKQCFVFF